MSELYNHSGGRCPPQYLDNGIPQNIKLTLTVPELADQLNISRTTAYNLVRQEGFYPAFRLGNRQLVGTEALSRWLSEQTGGKSNG